MTVGIRIRNPNTGEIILDTEDRLTTIIGISNTGQSSGSKNNTDLKKGVPFVLPMGADPQVLRAFHPIFKVESGRISWTFSRPGDTFNTAVNFIYGIVT